MKKLLSIILSILMVMTMIPMAVLPVYAATEATEPSAAVRIAYSAGATQYLKHNNYLYKVIYTNLKVDVDEVGLSYDRYNQLALHKALTNSNFLLTSYRGKNAYLSDLPTDPGSSIAFYTSSMYASNEKDPVVTVTCIAVEEPVWTWKGTSSATAKFTSTDGNATMTVGATIGSTTQTATTCLEKDKTTYTATATANGKAYTNEKTTYGKAGTHTGGTATCTEKAVCETCGASYGEVNENNHDIVIDEAVAPKCEETGLTEGQHCSRCDNATVAQEVVPSNGHTEGEVVVEDVVRKTCTTDGSYCNVVYCTECGLELSHDTVEVPASHNIETVETKAPTCTDIGWEAYEYCTECNYSTYKEIPSNGHTEETVKGYDATCTETGLTDGVKCAVCGETLTAQTEIAVKGHKDADGDYLCDNGCGYEYEKPADPTPDTPDEPTDDACDHLCHKSGFIGFIWKIVQFFSKLCKINPTCECGVAHY